MNRREFVLRLAALPSAMSMASPSSPAVWDGTDQIRFVLEDPLDHPFYWWPRTLLSYPIEFREPVDLDRLTLTRSDTGERVPTQFSEVVRGSSGLLRATLHFFSDLPSGARRVFVLSLSASPVVHAPQVKETSGDGWVELDSGVMRVRIPTLPRGRGETPGPVQAVSRSRSWIGSSLVKFSDGEVAGITTRKITDGPLFVVHEITYVSEGSSRYTVRVQCTGGMEFIRLQEDMTGLAAGARGLFTSEWPAFTHRQAPNHPLPLVPRLGSYDDYPWEKMDDPWRGRDITLGSSRPLYFESPPEGELPFCLGIFQSWPAYHVLTNANFWSEHTGDALGVFIDKAAEWQDNEYAYEVESTALQVRFHNQNGRFTWQWPLARGRRSTCIAFYEHEKDKQAMREFERAAQGVVHKGLTYEVGRAYTSHTMFLQNRYGTLDLNEVKDWVLAYPDDGRRPGITLSAGMVHDPAELERRMMTSGYVDTLPIFGARENGGSGPVPGRNIVNFSPVPSRQIEAAWIGGFNSSASAMDERQRRRLTAMLLFLAYVHMGDDYMPVVPMLGGHPNFLADVKAGMAMIAFLFPDHPMAPVWADQWEKCVELNTRFNTRPAVENWDARGGRWTENLGTYVWAFLRPSLRAAFLLRQYDGVERFLSPQIVELADWLVNALSAPFDGENEEALRILQQFDGGREWGVVAPGKGPRRVYPPQGAHAERRMPPASLWHLGNTLLRYAPLSGEYAMWAARPTNQETETAPDAPPTWEKMYNVTDNTGTDPHLRSSKFTGYGIVLRGGAGTRDEVSIHLQQIDEGPNYRWGRAGEGGCGVLYFFAAGRAYSHNGPEDTGDRLDQDTDFCTSFGVFKEGRFRGIGMNVLARPMYDLGTGQFAELVPRHGASAYSAPEYAGRSVLLAGHEYFLLYDAVLDSTIRHRLSWFVRRGEELPAIKLLRGAESARDSQQTRIQTDLTHGVWFDGVGDSMAVVSHRKDIVAEAAPFGARVRTGAVQDLVFRNPDPIEFAESGMQFHGTAGLIRKAEGRVEFALFHGTRIGVSSFLLETQDTELGFGCLLSPDRAPSGEFYAPQASSIRIRVPGLSERAVFYVDGAARSAVREADALVINLGQGRRHWELTDRLPVPPAPWILRTGNHSGGAQVFVQPVASATEYRLELSHDAGATWSPAGTWRNLPLDIGGLPEGRKMHVRVVARNAGHESEPGPEYPLYVTNQPPPPPDGIHLDLSAGRATITWGEVLGVTEYRLYARQKGTREFQVIYRGLERAYVDARAGIRPGNPIPLKPSPSSPSEIIEYAVAASDGNGEGVRSRVVDTDPQSWRNWNPNPGERFRRIYSSEPIYPPVPGQWPRYYPE